MIELAVSRHKSLVLFLLRSTCLKSVFLHASTQGSKNFSGLDFRRLPAVCFSYILDQNMPVARYEDVVVWM